MIRNRLSIKENQEEDTIRISDLLPVSVYMTDFSDRNYPTVRWHWHEDFQLCIITKGKIRFQTAGKSYFVSKGNVFFINSRSAHFVEPVEPDSAYYCVDFLPSLIAVEDNQALYQAVIAPFLSGNLPPAFLFDASHPAGVRLTRTVRRIVNISEGEHFDGWELLLHGEILSAWPDILKLARCSVMPDTPGNSTSNERLTKTMEFLHAHFSEKLTLSEIAASIGLCPEECERFFKRMTGMTTFQYLLEYRITKSREFLADPRLAIAEIAQNTGFSSQSYFTSCFKKIVGCTPNKYRKQ